MVAQSISVVSEVQGDARWVVASRRIPEDLAPWISSWVGYSELRASPHVQRELPSGLVHLIFEFGPPLAVSRSGGEECRPRREPSFVAGLDDCFALTQHAGEQAGVQVSLTPTGARRVLGLPLHLLTRHVVDLGDLECSRACGVRRFAELETWEQRFDWVTAFLRARLEGSRARRDIAWAVDRIRGSDGRVVIADLARELGFSRKHLAALFQDQVGVTPKLYAELTRFERVAESLKGPTPPRWASLAQRFGFADQAHLGRSMKRFSGLTPRELQALLGAPHVELFEAR